jgi:DNA-binding NarL/FixJ family response regulator
MRDQSWSVWLDAELERLQGELALRLPLSGDVRREAGRLLAHEALRRNRGAAPSGLAALSPREGEVLRFACLGHHNKLIAFELGLSSSTVRVLLWRAMRKLGVRSREELVRLAGSSASADTQPVR